MNILLNSRSCMLLQSISKQTGSQGINEIGRNAYATYKSKWEVVNELEGLGLVFFEKFGREVIAYLTPEGEKVLKYVSYITSLKTIHLNHF